MSARVELWIVGALFMASAGGASAASLGPGVGATPSDPAAAANSNSPAYDQAGTTDPYNRPGFTTDQSFGLTIAQMLGAAAACEQIHSQSISLDGLKTKKSAGDTDAGRADIDAAQQNMLDPAATTPNDPNAGEADCDRISNSFSQLQWIEAQDKNLGKELNEPDALGADNKNKSRQPR